MIAVAEIQDDGQKRSIMISVPSSHLASPFIRPIPLAKALLKLLKSVVNTPMSGVNVSS